MECLGCKKEKNKRYQEDYNSYFRKLAPKNPAHVSENLLLIVRNSYNTGIEENYFCDVKDANSNLKIIESETPMYKISKKQLRCFEKNVSRRNIKRLIIIFLLDPSFVNSDVDIFVSLSTIFKKYKDKNLFCMSYILLKDNYHENNNDISEKNIDTSISNENNDVMKSMITKVNKRHINNISYFKCYTTANILRGDLIKLLFSMNVSRVLGFFTFFEFKIDKKFSSFSLNINRYITL